MDDKGLCSLTYLQSTKEKCNSIYAGPHETCPGPPQWDFSSWEGDLGDVEALLADAGGHQGVEGALSEVGQHCLLLALRHAATAALARAPALPYEHPAHAHAPYFQSCSASLQSGRMFRNHLNPNP